MTIIKAFNKARNTTYVYEADFHWDKSNQQSRSKRKLIGKIDSKTAILFRLDRAIVKNLDVERKLTLQLP